MKCPHVWIGTCFMYSFVQTKIFLDDIMRPSCCLVVVQRSWKAEQGAQNAHLIKTGSSCWVPAKHSAEAFTWKIIHKPSLTRTESWPLVLIYEKLFCFYEAPVAAWTPAVLRWALSRDNGSLKPSGTQGFALLCLRCSSVFGHKHLGVRNILGKLSTLLRRNSKNK